MERAKIRVATINPTGRLWIMILPTPRPDAVAEM